MSKRIRTPTKRTASPADPPSSGKKRKPVSQTISSILQSELQGGEDSNTSSPVAFGEGEPSAVTKTYVFKNPNFTHSSKGTTKRGPGHRSWKTLKQIMVTERSIPCKPDEINYEALDAPPSFKPAKKYSDLSGLQAKYTDPQTKIRYANAEEFSRIKMLPSDIVAGYLALRKANPAVP